MTALRTDQIDGLLKGEVVGLGPAPRDVGAFLRQIAERKLLPAGFDPVGYRLSNGDIPGLDEDWKAILHFLRAGRQEGRDWKRPFDPVFYAELYFDGQNGLDPARLEAAWAREPARYGSMREALVRNGFTSEGWIPAFDHQAYLVYNTLTERLRTTTQAVVHFIEHGWRAMLPISGEHVFEPGFYQDFVDAKLDAGGPELYRLWIEVGLPRDAAPNQRAQLRKLGTTLSTYPEGFDWQAYLAARPEAAPGRRHRWGALEHFLETGVFDRRPAFAEPAVLRDLVLEAADRFARAGRNEESDRAYDHLLTLPDLPVRALQHAADDMVRRNRFGAALALYHRVREAGAATLWTWANAANCALAVADLDGAEQLLLAALRLYPRNPHLLASHEQLIRHRFDLAAISSADAFHDAEAAAHLERALDAILESCVAAHRAQFGNGARAGRPDPETPLRIAMFANQDLPQCTFYRVSQKLEQLASTRVQIEIVDHTDATGFVSALATANIALFYRVAANPGVLRCLASCRVLGIPTVYETDDLVFDPAHFPDAFESYAGAISRELHRSLQEGVPLVRYALKQCDYALASTDALARHMQAMVRTGTAEVHRNGLSAELERLARGAAPRPSGRAVTIFYGSGTKAHGADFHALLEPALTRLMHEHPELSFMACGHVDAAALALMFPDRVKRVELQPDRNAFLSLLLGIDINVSVLGASEFNDCKSEIKWLEAAAFCVPSVVSDVGGMRETLRPGEDVLVCPPNPSAWYAALRRLVLNAGERERIGRNARDRALALYAPAVLGQRLDSTLRRFAGLPASPRAARKRRRPRVLVVNVFYPPQSIGGATRVVFDQVNSILGKHAHRFEIGVLCGNDEHAEPYRTETYAWGAAQVWSVATPARQFMDWMHLDPNVAASVDAVLDSFRPDLVHFHCIQRLTLTAVERVRRRGIPYIISVHDCWWISDHQFLMDGLSRLCMPWDLEKHDSPANPHTLAESGARKLAMRGALDGAAAVLAVSESFADLYRRAGISRVRALPNAIPQLPALEPTPTQPGRVRIGHLGGVVHHKGYFLLQHTLQRGAYDRIEVVATDHTLDPSEVRRESWAATPATIYARIPQDRVGWLYGQFDVLAAPSIWPESFGLVAREALSYGRWVIASDRGAMGSDIEPGVNGWVIDVSSPDALRPVLDELQAHPDRFNRPHRSPPPARTVDDMVRDVVAVWDRVLEDARPAS